MSKLTYEDKINLYNDRKNGLSISVLVSKNNIRHEIIEYLIRLIDKHGLYILRTNKNKYYSLHEKERIINRVLINNESRNFVAIDEGLASSEMLYNWIKKYKEMGYNIVEQKRGRSPTMPKVTKKKENETDKEKIKKIRGRKFIFKSGARILKKIESRCSSKEESTTEEKVNVVSELRLTYPLTILLQVSGLAKSVYYYTLSKVDKDVKNKEIFINNKERYGYRRITLELRN